MPDLTKTLTQRFQRAIVAAFGDEHSDIDPLIRPSANPKFGDYQANVAMSLAKQVGGEPPRDIAQKIIEQLHVDDICEKTPDIAGPGFINLYLSTAFLNDRVNRMARDERLDVPTVDPPQTVVVDYSSPNVAKEMHVGHLRSTIIGDCIARVLEFQGDTVIRQNHIGDWGTQFGRVMLGLWYEAAAKHADAMPQLDNWIDRAKPTQLPSKKDDKSSDNTKARRELQKDLLEEIVPAHNAWFQADPDGDVYFIKYLRDNFPNLERLQELYAFASKITSVEDATDFSMAMKDGTTKSLASLPSHIATYVQNHGVKDNEPEKLAWEKSRQVSLETCQSVYDRLGVQLTMDHVRGESFYTLGMPEDPQDRLTRVIDRLDDAKLLTTSEEAKVVFPDGFTNRDGEPLAMIVKKSDGGFLYATTDLAAALFRIEEKNATRIVYVTDARQAQHFAMLFQVLRQVNWAPAKVLLDHVPFGTVMGKDGKPLQTRDGGTVRLVDLLDEAESRASAILSEKNPDLPDSQRQVIARAVGIGSLKYADLSSDRIKDYIFDWDRMLSFDGNTAPYIQNAYVRVHGIFRKGEIDIASLSDKTIMISEPQERQLAIKLLQLPSVIESVSQSLEPHRLCTYLYELASAYHKFFENCPVLAAKDDATKQSRLRLCDVVAETFKCGLGLLGIDVVERM